MDRRRSSLPSPRVFVAVTTLLLLIMCCFSVVKAAPQGGTIAGTTDQSLPVDGKAIGEASFGAIQAVMVDEVSGNYMTSNNKLMQGSYTIIEEKYIRRVSGGEVTTLANWSTTSSIFIAFAELGNDYLVLDNSAKRCIRKFSKANSSVHGVFFGSCALSSTTDGARGLAVDESTNTVYMAQTYENRIMATTNGGAGWVVSSKNHWQPLSILVANSSFAVVVDAKFDLYKIKLVASGQLSTEPVRVTHIPESLSKLKALTPVIALDKNRQIFYYLSNPEVNTANTSSIVKWNLNTDTFSTLYTFRAVGNTDGSDPTYSSITSMAVTPEGNLIIGQQGRLRYLLVRGYTNTPTIPVDPVPTPPPPPPPPPPQRTRTKTIRAFANITASFLVSGFPFHNETAMDEVMQLMRADAEEAMDGLTPIGDMVIETVDGKRYFTVVFQGIYLDKQEEAQRRLDNCPWNRLRKNFILNGRGAICVYQDGRSECDADTSTRCDSLGCHLAVGLTIALCFLIILLVIIFLALTVGGRAFLKSALLLYPVAP